MKKRKPDLFLVMSDALRPDHLGCYGYNRSTSPFIDTWAKKSIQFLSATTQAPFTMSSVASIFTSLYPSQHGVLRYTHSIPSTLPQLSKTLKQEGYQTAAFVLNPHISEYSGYRGFDTFYQGERLFELIGNAINKISSNSFIWWGNARTLTKRVEEYLDQPRSKPLFAFLFYIDTHNPFSPPMKFFRQFNGSLQKKYFHYSLANPDFKKNKYTDQAYQEIMDRYDSEILMFDHYFEKLVNLIQPSLQEGGSLILTSDHGEGFRKQSAGHGQLYEDGMHIPLFIHSPVLPSGTAPGLAGTIDLFPTLLDLAGIDVPTKLMGSSLLPMVRDTSYRLREYIFSENMSSRAIRTERYKLINNRKGILPQSGNPDPIQKQNPPEELYDLKNNPQETNNLANSNSPQLHELRNRLNQFQKSIRAYHTKRSQDKLNNAIQQIQL